MIQIDTALRNWLALNHIPNCGPIRIHSLLEIFDTPLALFEAGQTAWEEAGLSEKMIQHLSAPDWDKVDADLNGLNKKMPQFLHWMMIAILLF